MFTLAAPLAAPARADEPFFTGVGFLPGGRSFSGASGISADGSTVVGHAASWGWQGFEAFRWTRDEGMAGLGVLPGRDSSKAYGASVDGSVIVGLSYPAPEAFRWTAQDGMMIGLGDLPGGEFDSAAVGVSADGSVVVGGGSSEYSQNYEAFRWTAEDGMVGLGDLPGGNFLSWAYAVSADGRVIVGVSRSDMGDEAFRWTVEEGMIGLGDLPGGVVSSVAHDVSADGRIIVGQGRTDEGWEAFRWTAEDGMLGLGYLGGALYPYSEAFAVSGDGSVVAGQAYGEQYRTAFIWDAEHGMRDLRDVLTNELGLELKGWWLDNALGISGDGRTIAGVGFNPDGYTEGWVAHIPEPGTALLLIVGLAAALRTRPRERAADTTTGSGGHPPALITAPQV